MPTYVMLPSVLVGGATWRPVSEVLAGGGAEVVVASTDGCTSTADVLAAYVAAVPSTAGEVVLVPHSNAGLYAPAVAARTGAVATVHVDAALPPTTGPADPAPAGLLDHLRQLADAEGLLPPWTRWWPDIDRLFPDDATRASVQATEPRLPLSYFDGTIEVPAGWEERPNAYLAFGGTYAPELARAEALSWPTRRVDGGHLHVLHDPAGCAALIAGLAHSLRPPPRAGGTATPPR